MRTTLIVTCLLAAAVGAAAPAALGGGHRSPTAASAIRPLSGLPASPAPDAVTAALGAQHPRPSTVGRVRGPFDDRLRLTGLALSGHAVSGGLTVTSDVSEILEVEVLAGFYDARGQLLGTASYVRHGEDFADVNEHLGFSIRPAPAYAARVASAAVGVPVLVNE